MLNDLRALGYQKIVGLDEVGRGALAGPMIVAAVELPVAIPGVTDSKLLSRQQREELATQITRSAVQQQFGVVSNIEIDQLGLTAALQLAYARALEKVGADLYLTDYVRLPDKRHMRAIKGDSLFYPVAAASVVAKVYRDNLMRQLHAEFEPYSWDQNVGYGTARHLDAIRKFGPTIYHRKSFLKPGF